MSRQNEGRSTKTMYGRYADELGPAFQEKGVPMQKAGVYGTVTTQGMQGRMPMRRRDDAHEANPGYMVGMTGDSHKVSSMAKKAYDMESNRGKLN